MTLGASLFLIGLGAILKYAVTARVGWIDLQATGVCQELAEKLLVWFVGGIRSIKLVHGA